LVAGAGVIVSTWEAEVKLAEETESVWTPAVVSLKKKAPLPEVIATDVMVPLKGPVLLVSNRILGEVEDKLAVPVKPVTLFPKPSRASKVTWEENTPAVTV
jgi:hypothetical protein